MESTAPSAYLAKLAYQRFAQFVPSEKPVILESIINAAEMNRELNVALNLFAAYEAAR